MQTDWRDPRDGTRWLITVSALGFPAPGVHDTSRPRVISFHCPGRRPQWTSYPGDGDTARATDQELMDLLDAARHSSDPRIHPPRDEPARLRRPG